MSEQVDAVAVLKQRIKDGYFINGRISKDAPVFWKCKSMHDFASRALVDLCEDDDIDATSARWRGEELMKTRAKKPYRRKEAHEFPIPIDDNGMMDGTLFLKQEWIESLSEERFENGQRYGKVRELISWFEIRSDDILLIRFTPQYKYRIITSHKLMPNGQTVAFNALKDNQPGAFQFYKGVAVDSSFDVDQYFKQIEMIIRLQDGGNEGKRQFPEWQKYDGCAVNIKEETV